MFNATVAETIYNMVDFSGDSRNSLIALWCSIVCNCYLGNCRLGFGIPTSESHALIAGITGSAIALQGGLSGVNPAEWIKVVYGLLFSTAAGFGFGFLTTKLIELICKNMDRRKTEGFFKNGQIVGAASMAFMHGAQDGQKFMGVLCSGFPCSG